MTVTPAASSKAKHVPYSMLAQITENFSDLPFENGGKRVGAGAFGIVYHATIPAKVLSGDSEGGNCLILQDI